MNSALACVRAKASARFALPQRIAKQLRRVKDERLALRGDLAALRVELSELRTQLAQLEIRTFDRLIEFEIRTRRDIVYSADQDAARDSGRFLSAHMAGAHGLRTPRETLQFALSQAPAGGLALEFGVATGSTLRQIADRRGGVQVYGFDSFEGLPEDWAIGVAKGAFARTQLPEVPGAELVVGWFDDTLPRFLAEHPGAVNFLHVDCDLYSSAVTVLTHVGPRLAPGAIVHFDEFFNYPGWQQHEARAWAEYVERTGTEFEYLAYCYADRQVTVRITGTDTQNSVPSTGRPRSAS